MTPIQRIRVTWDGFIGAPGVSTFYANTAATLVPQLNTFFAALVNTFPTDVHIKVQPEGDELESTTGELTGGWAGGASAPVVGSGAGGYSAVSGELVQWKSPAVLSGRRLRGHTFLVPIVSAAYDASGQVAASYLAICQAAATALIAASAGNMLLYQRPRVARAGWTDYRGHVHPAVTARSGGYGPVTTGTARAIVTELKSRRD
jgi:hypothetical protein